MSLLVGVGETRQSRGEIGGAANRNVPGVGIVQGTGNVAVVPDELAEPLRDLASPVRRSRYRFNVQLALPAIHSVMQEGFGIKATKKAGKPPKVAMPRGVHEVDPARVNNDPPSGVTYGSLVVQQPSSAAVVF